MLWRTHLVMGLSAGYLVVGPDVALLAAAGVISLIPDIDHPGSKVGRKAPVFSVVLRIFFGHRGVLHSLAGVVVFGLAAALAGGQGLGVAVVAGYLAHLLGDILTPYGVPLLWPLPWRVRIPVVKTGGMLERYVVFPVVLVGLVVLVGGNYWGKVVA